MFSRVPFESADEILFSDDTHYVSQEFEGFVAPGYIAGIADLLLDL